MRVSDSRRLVFIHVQKAGGSTIGAMLDHELNDARVVKGCIRHAPLIGILKKEPQLRSYWIVGFVRNPWDRMVSWWAMIRDVLDRAEQGDPECQERLKNNPVFWRPMEQMPDFEAFIMRGTTELKRLRKPQLTFLEAAGRRADFIGRLESFDADVAAMRARLGLPQLQQTPRENVSPHAEYRTYYTARTRDHIGALFAADVKAFGYDF